MEKGIRNLRILQISWREKLRKHHTIRATVKLLFSQPLLIRRIICIAGCQRKWNDMEYILAVLLERGWL